MAIEISNHTLSLVKGTSESSSPPLAERNGAPGSPPVSAQDTVAITAAADTLNGLEQQVSSLPVVDLQRVSQVRGIVDQIQNSSNFSQMAEKIMNFESALNRARA